MLDTSLVPRVLIRCPYNGADKHSMHSRTGDDNLCWPNTDVNQLESSVATQ